MSYPSSITNRTVIVGGGVHGAIYAATYFKATGVKPVILEAGTQCGGIFGRVIPFQMNSTHAASIDSVTGGPTRIPSRVDGDDLNYLPNSPFQVTCSREYPSTTDMAYAVRQTAEYAADVYTGARAYVSGNGVDIYEGTDLNGRYLGYARRTIWATGLAMTDPATPIRTDATGRCTAIVTAEAFLGDINPYAARISGRIAVIGGGDTACTVIEYLLGQGETAIYGTRPTDIDWYGGYALPTTKKRWALDFHARYIGIARHMPQNGREGILHPKAVQVTPEPLGDYAQVQGRNYRLVIDATGFKPLSCPVSANTLLYDVTGNQVIARSNSSETFVKIGPAAKISGGNPYFPNKFPAANQAIYVLAPRTAIIAARHAAEDLTSGDLG